MDYVLRKSLQIYLNLSFFSLQKTGYTRARYILSLVFVRSSIQTLLLITS